MNWLSSTAPLFALSQLSRLFGAHFLLESHNAPTLVESHLAINGVLSIQFGLLGTAMAGEGHQKCGLKGT